jgi:polysaccharide pyruvyl transferase WcaK-like protein
MKDVNIGLFTADLNSANMGCNALTYSALLMLEEVSVQLGIEFRYTLFTQNKPECLVYYETLSQVDIQMVETIVFSRDIIKKLLKRDFESIRKFRRSIKRCDVFFEIAGGDSYSDIYGLRRPVRFDLCHSRVMRNDKPMVFLPQTVGPFNSAKALLIAKKGLSYASHIFARDPISFETASELSEKDNISQTIDMAFFMDYEPEERTLGKKRIGINPSGLLWNGGYKADNQFGLKADYREMLSSVIESIDRGKYEIYLVGHVLQGAAFSVEDDYKVCKWLQKKYPYCKLTPFFYSPMEAKSFISGLDLLVGSRMHCCIAAYSSGVPIFPLAYSRKFKGLFKEELKYPYGAELVSDDTQGVIDGLHELLKNLGSIRQEMPTRTQALALYKTELVDVLSTVISESIMKPGGRP